MSILEHLEHGLEHGERAEVRAGSVDVSAWRHGTSYAVEARNARHAAVWYAPSLTVALSRAMQELVTGEVAV